jgi:hypothetical protein
MFLTTKISMNSQTPENFSYLIIGGTTKAATTSVFNYLAEHPAVCASNLKETRFFLDPEYPLPSKFRYTIDASLYSRFFSHCREKLLRIEATPDYLHSPGTPHKIRTSLQDVRLVFVLREPVSRLVSWYRFAKQIGWISSNCLFDAFVLEQLHATEGDSRVPLHMLTLQQGRYSSYLRAFLEVFGRERIHVAWFEELTQNPKAVVKGICEFADIDPVFFENFRFDIFNKGKSIAARSKFIHCLYMRTSEKVRYLVADRRCIRQVLRSVRHFVEPVYLKLNTRVVGEHGVSPSTLLLLDDYYRSETEALAALLGRTPPWQSTGGQ